MHLFIIAKDTFIAIAPIVNPLGMTPIFLTLTQHTPQKERHKIARQVAINFFLVVFLSLLFGKLLLLFLHLNFAYLYIVGGALVSYAAWGMTHASIKQSDLSTNNKYRKTTSFYPLTFPITAGAGTIAVVLTLGMQIQEDLLVDTFKSYCATVLGLLFTAISVFFCYRHCDKLFAFFGQPFTRLLTICSSILLLSIGLNLIYTGITSLLIR